jgi:hypothetical protein
MSFLVKSITTGRNIYNHECQINSPDGIASPYNAAPTKGYH